ncbi:MAG: hypothetical protein EHM43_00995 [Ignavibacteriae bacterium]|nr:MAG: hypothetical protein EHM43_00995 [Ignavibacteriota bacterium]
MRQPTIAALLHTAATAARSFTPESVEQLSQVITDLSQHPLGSPKQIIAYHDVLLFVEANPATRPLYDLARSEMHRLVHHVHARSKGRSISEFQNSGIAGSVVRSGFSLGLNAWLVKRFGAQVELYAEGLEQDRVVQTLNHMLDPVEYEMLHAGKMEWDHWSTSLVGQGADPHRIKKWIVTTAERLPGSTAMREYVFSQFALTTQWRTTPDIPSMSTGRAPRVNVHIHDDGLIKRMTLREAFAQKAPRKMSLTAAERAALGDLAKGVLCLQLRETDPSTHAEPKETLYYDLGRGITIALFSMKADMKMALQSYIGFMVFKNGVPCAYGGGWVMNDDSGFGVNIFPPFRGGESAVIVSQLLRLYRHVFHVDTFNVDPYQIGYGNPDGIASGAFWFYYRLGFRPVERRFLQLAASEAKAMKEDRTYRTSSATLKILAGSTMRWTLPGLRRPSPITADAIGDVVTHHVNTVFAGDRQAALRQALTMIGARIKRPVSSKHPVSRIAVLLQACGYLESASRSELSRLIRDYPTKLVNEADYVRASQQHPLLFQCLHEAELRS